MPPTLPRPENNISPRPTPLQPAYNGPPANFTSPSFSSSYPNSSFPPPNQQIHNGAHQHNHPPLPPMAMYAPQDHRRPPVPPNPAMHAPVSGASITAKRAATGAPPGESPAAKKKQSKWTSDEDASIIRLRGDGMKWEDISKNLPGRSAISCRLRFQNYLERRSEWDEEKKNKLARLYERFKKDMWEKISREMALPWRAAEAMHWQIGESEMAHRANVAVFHLAGTNNSTPSAPSNTAQIDYMANSPSPNMHSRSLPSLHQYAESDGYAARYDTRAPTPSHSLLAGPQGPAPEEYGDYRGRPASRTGNLDIYHQPTGQHRYPSPYPARATDHTA